MADLSITASSVVPGNTAAGEERDAGEAIDAGEAVYINSTDGKAYLAKAGGTEAQADVKGIAVQSVAAGQPVRFVRQNSLTINSAATTATLYFLSATAGKLCPEADLTSGQYKRLIAVATAATTLSLKVNNLGVSVP